METKLYSKDCITLDGRMDEPVWDSVKTYTGFKHLGTYTEAAAARQTCFKIIPCEDRIYVGIKCMTDNMEALKNAAAGSWGTPAIELFLSPSGNPYDFYQFFVGSKGASIALYFEECGVTKPDPYAPHWNSAVYMGEDYWSTEIELPLTAFYMTSHDRWRDTWLVNVARTHVTTPQYSTWSWLKSRFSESNNFTSVEGFPIRPIADDLCITSVTADITEQTAESYQGTMKVLTKNAVAGTYEFSSSFADTVTVKLEEGVNEFTVPCRFEDTTRYRVDITLKRAEDGKEFKRWYPVIVTYEPIVVKFSLPEYRSNFYPGQDATRIVGKVIAAKPVTLKLEGPGIETTVVSPDAEGNFSFDTPNFEIGDAYLTATIDGYETVKKIRHLAPTGHMMSWISGGNLIVNGEPLLRRNMYAEYYMGGEAFRRKYDADDLHQTLEIVGQTGWLEPERLIKGSGAPGKEATLDKKPCEEMLQKIDETLEANKDRDFAYYYISDEPECRGLSRIYLGHLYDYIAEKDPYHVILSASRNAGEMVGIADWFETHPYINPNTEPDGTRVYARKISTMGKFVDDVIKLNRPDKCIGFLPTCFAGMAGKPEPYPTFDEYICHTWAGMIRGGKTLNPYAYHDMNDRASMYEGTRYIFSSFEALDKLVLLAERTVLVKDQEVEAVLYKLGEEKMFVAVNMTNEPKKITLEGISGTWNEFRHNRTISGNTFTLKPLEVLIGTTEVKDKDLPTYQEVAELIDKQEYERTHGGSLLFERRNDIKITSSGSIGWIRKLFDGVSDNLGWTQVGDMEKYVELDLTNVKPSFTKVVVNGWHIEDAKLILKNGDKALEPVAEVQTEEFATTFLLKEAVTPDALRLEFSQKHVELYEISVF